MSIGPGQANALVGALSSLVRTVRAAGQRRSGQAGASGTPLCVLSRLRAGDTRPSDLAAALQVAPSVVSRTLTRLQHADLVERRDDPDDARASRVALTRLGRRRLEQLLQRDVEQVREVLGDWNDADVAQAAELMTRLEQALAQTYLDDTRQRLIPAGLLAPALDDGVRDTDLDPATLATSS